MLAGADAIDFDVWRISLKYEYRKLHMEQHQVDASMARSCKEDSRFPKLIFFQTDLLSDDDEPHCFCGRNTTSLQTYVAVRQVIIVWIVFSFFLLVLPKQDVQRLRD